MSRALNASYSLSRSLPASRPSGSASFSYGLLILVAAAIYFTATYVAFPLAAAMYIIGLVLLTLVRPDLTLVIIFASAPFVFDVGGGPVKLALSDVSLMIAFPILLMKRRCERRVPLGLLNTLAPVLYFLVCIVSMTVNGIAASSITSLLQMAVYLFVATYTFQNCVTPDYVRPALYALLASNAYLALGMMLSGSSFAVGMHKNALGAQLCFGVIISFELCIASSGKTRRNLTAVLALLAVGLILTLSRGAWLGTIVGLSIVLVLRRQGRLALRSLLCLAVVVAICWHWLPEESKEYALDFNASAWNIKARYDSIDFAMSCFKSSPLLGVGVGLRKAYDATNVVMSTLAETGIMGLVAFSSIFVAFYLAVWKGQRRLDRRDPRFTMLSIGAALVIAKLVHGCVDHYWSRGILPVFAAMGLALQACAINPKAARSMGYKK